MRRRPWPATVLGAFSALGTGCGPLPAALDPAGPQAERLAELTWWFTAVCAAVYLLVLAALAIALVRWWRHREPLTAPVSRGPMALPEPGGERWLSIMVAGAAAATLLVLAGLLLASAATGAAVTAAAEEAELEIEVTGHQWWWRVVYPGAMASERVTTANEIRLPVGVTVHLRLASADVIHSFWVPRLHGKMDLVPGRSTDLWLSAERAGVYRGQCAEFCGHQHAHMGLSVIAQPRDGFEAWLAGQRRPAPAPGSALERRGREVFLASPCVLCHTVRGTPAGGRTGPDLTHLASRSTIASGALPNRRGHLAGWILDSQGVKPGNAMPPVGLSGEELQALLAYLESLE